MWFVVVVVGSKMGVLFRPLEMYVEVANLESTISAKDFSNPLFVVYVMRSSG